VILEIFKILSIFNCSLNSFNECIIAIYSNYVHFLLHQNLVSLGISKERQLRYL